MDLTTEQQEQVRKAKAAGEKRAILEFTGEQKRQWTNAVAEELDGKKKNLTLLCKIRAAAEEPGFLGDVRRAITASRRSLADLAAETGVEPHVLSDFRAGDAELPLGVLDRLLEVLRLRLMQEIPRA